MSEIIKEMVENIDQILGNKPFYSVRELVKCGIFGSLVSARRALQGGRLLYVKISQRRFVVIRQELLSFLQNNIEGK